MPEDGRLKVVINGADGAVVLEVEDVWCLDEMDAEAAVWHPLCCVC